MILWMLACGAEKKIFDPEVTESPVPVAGFYDVTVAEEWDGDCNLDDPVTCEAPEQEWEADPRGDVLILYQDYWTPSSCVLTGLDFVCDDGSWNESRAQVTKTVEGTFTEDGEVSGVKAVELDCGGAGCDILEEMYGQRLDVPCRVEAAFEGSLGD